MDPEIVVRGQQGKTQCNQRAPADKQGTGTALGDALKENAFVEVCAFHAGEYIANFVRDARRGTRRGQAARPRNCGR